MAGHSKWANIKHRKARQDKKRGKIFTRLIRALMVAARLGGEERASNPRLRDAVKTAKDADIPNDTIERAIVRGVGGAEGTQVEEVRYEGYGPGGVAVMVDCITDNRNRTVAEVRHAFTQSGGNLGTDGSVSYLFSKQGIITFASVAGEDQIDEDKIMEIALDTGAEDIKNNDDGSLDVITTPENFSNVVDAFEKADLKPDYAEVSMVASTEVTLDEEGAEKIMRLIDTLEDLDDTQHVYSNADIPDDVIQKLM